MKIEPIRQVGSSRQGTLVNLYKKDIETVLGFSDNVTDLDDPDKVSLSWGFTADGIRCGIWSYRDSHNVMMWSTYGPHVVFYKLFGDNYERD